VFRVKHLNIDTLAEHVVFIRERAVEEGNLGFQPLDRVRVFGSDDGVESGPAITGILNFCRDEAIIAPDEIGLSDLAFSDLGLSDGASVNATLAPAPPSVDLVRGKLRGRRLDAGQFEEILTDVVEHRYSKVELSMFVLACALKTLSYDELVALTEALISTGRSLNFDSGPIADKHCIGGIPGNRTTMIVVPILVSLGIKVPKTSSRSITSPAGTADTMGVLAEVAPSPERIYEVVDEVGGCIVWGGALALAPADDILITVERPMEIDTEPQMVASILAKKKTAGATHALIDIPVGRHAKVRSHAAAAELCELFSGVAHKVGLELDIVVTEARGPIGFGIGPRLEALDVLSVLECDTDAPRDLREKSLYLAARTLELVGATGAGGGYRAAQEALDSGAARRTFARIVEAQGARELPPEARFRREIRARNDGRIREIDCWRIARVAKLAGAPANVSAGVRVLRGVGDVVQSGDALYEVHAQSRAQLDFACDYADQNPDLYLFGF
jgi:thymidine phosphorylase